MHSGKLNGRGGNFYGTNQPLPLLYPVPNPRMKLKPIATLCLLAAGLAVARAQEPNSVAPAQAGAPAAAAPADAAQFTDAQIFEEYGWFVGKRVGLTELEPTKENLEQFVKGLMAASAGKESPYELDQIGPKMDELMQKRSAAYAGKLKEKNSAKNLAYFEKLKENKNIVELPSGLRYEILKQGTGPTPKPSDTVKVHYHGTLLDGAVFDSSVKRGQPIDFKLDEVIPGWTEGLQKINKGGKIKLHVPSQLAYGDEGRPGIPPASTLIFEVDLLDINPPGTAMPPPPAGAQPAKK